MGKVSSEVMYWRSKNKTVEEEYEEHDVLHGPRRTLLFQVSEMLEINECGLDFLDEPEDLKTTCRK